MKNEKQGPKKKKTNWQRIGIITMMGFIIFVLIASMILPLFV